jgi:Ni/Fe-hydrogenase 1 B-type cytochrome subunit
MSATASSDIVRVYVWELPVRITHWLIAFSIVVLSVTGFYIGYPFVVVSGPAGEHFVMGWAKVLHAYTAYVFLAAVVARVIWMFTGNWYARWNSFIPVRAPRRRGIWQILKFYLFLLREPPPSVGHNALAGVTYSLVFAVYFVVIATGLILRGAGADVESPLRWFASWAPLFGGLQITRWIHHAAMWLLLGFAVHHVYSGVAWSVIQGDGTMESIFSGYKFVPRDELRAADPGYVSRKG